MLPWPVKETDFRFREREISEWGHRPSPVWFHRFICVTASPMFGCSNKLLLLLACCYCPKSQHSKMAVPDRFLVFFSFQQSGAQFKQLIQLRPHAYRTILSKTLHVIDGTSDLPHGPPLSTARPLSENQTERTGRQVHEDCRENLPPCSALHCSSGHPFQVQGPAGQSLCSADSRHASGI